MKCGEHIRGVALVITMILLAVITTLAIAFLALTYRETGAVDSKARTTDAELGAESALERAKAQILSEMLLRNVDTKHPDIMGPDLQVSVAWHTNRLAPGYGNLFYDPSPPVFVDTNRGAGLTLEDRFSLDLNENTNYEETGWVQVKDKNGAPIVNTTNWVVGDPHWIGLLQDPLRPHGPDNRFIVRYAFLIQPIGRTLDLNWIHNQTLESLEPKRTMEDGSGFNGFYRNQGVGPWEMNLAGFLADLNPNYWGNYHFDPLARWRPNQANLPLEGFAPSVGDFNAFNDARELLRYRYLPLLPLRKDPAVPMVPSPRQSNDTMNALFPSAGAAIGDGVLAYANTLALPFGVVTNDNDDPSIPWPGSDSKRHYFTVHDVFDPKKLPEKQGGEFHFREHLLAASGQPGTEDRYTYYRMLAQLGTDSAPEEKKKLNLNFINIRSWVNQADELVATDMIGWTNLVWPVRIPRLGKDVDMGRPGPELFLHSVATEMFLREPGLRHLLITNDANTGPLYFLRIPVYTNGSSFTTNGPLYSGRIHQILKVAANILDATRPEARLDGSVQGPEYPTVFAPRFQVDGNDVYITDYFLVNSYATAIGSRASNWRDLELGQKPGRDDYVYGIPFIIGAKKGYPNFNELAVKTDVTAVRRLRMTRTPPSTNIVTEQGFTLYLTNYFGFEAWNSYTSSYPRPLELYFGLRTMSLVTNSASPAVAASNLVAGASTTLVAQAWQPKDAPGKNDYIWRDLPNHFVLGWTNFGALDPVGATNHWALFVTNRVLYFLVDNDHVVDAVTLSGPTNVFDIARELYSTNFLADGTATKLVWVPSKLGSGAFSLGVQNQLMISRFNSTSLASDQEWLDYSPTTLSRAAAIVNFNDFLTNMAKLETTVPFAAVRRMEQETRVRVNDPLVHFTLEDFEMEDPPRTETVKFLKPFARGSVNPTYSPWGGKNPASTVSDPALVDAGVFGSDFWEFHTNRFPNIGWLGRVHRATPWQTLYLKNADRGLVNWALSAGRVLKRNPAIVRVNTASLLPTNDWRWLDIFTAEIHPNASRGRLSINQTNSAAWSALLAGVVGTTVTNEDGFAQAAPFPIEPEAISPGVRKIVGAINRKRGTNNFTHLSDILSVPELTTESPLLKDPPGYPGFDAANPPLPAGKIGLRDSDYERIPQQVLGLLKVGEARFAVYAWGQSLKPARFGVVKNGPNVELRGPSIFTADVPGVGERGTVMNYQVTGEMATRTILRVEFDRDAVGEPDYRRPRIVVESFNVLPNE